MKKITLLLLIAITLSCKNSNEEVIPNKDESEARFSIVIDSLLNANNYKEAKKVISYGTNRKFNDTLLETAKSRFNKKKDSLLKLAEAEINKLENQLDFKKDEFEQVEWIYSKKIKKYGTRVEVYLGRQNAEINNPRFLLNYTGDNWIFWEKAIFLIDGEPIDYYPNKSPNTDNSGGTVYERLDVPLISKQAKIISKIMSAETVKVRLSGRKGYKEFNVSKNNIQGIRDVITYKTLFGLTKSLEESKL